MKNAFVKLDSEIVGKPVKLLEQAQKDGLPVTRPKDGIMSPSQMEGKLGNFPFQRVAFVYELRLILLDIPFNSVEHFAACAVGKLCFASILGCWTEQVSLVCDLNAPLESTYTDPAR